MLPYAKPIIRGRDISLPQRLHIVWTSVEWNPFQFTKSGSFSWGAVILMWVSSMHPMAEGKPPTWNKPCLISSCSARVDRNLMKSPNFAVKTCVTRQTTVKTHEKESVFWGFRLILFLHIGCFLQDQQKMSLQCSSISFLELNTASTTNRWNQCASTTF